MQLVYIPYMRVGPFLGTEGSFSVEVVATAIVVTNMPCTGIEQGVTNALGMLQGGGGHKLEESLLPGLQDLHILKFKHFG